MRLTSIDKSVTERLQTLLSKGYEINPQPLHHFRDVDGAVDGSKSIGSSYTFFNVASGQEGTTKEDTNMVKPSAIPQPDEMWVQSIRFVIMPAKNNTTPLLSAVDKANLQKHIINDIGRILYRGVVRVSQLGRDLLELSPLISVPSGMGVIAPSVFSFDTNMVSGIPMASLPLVSNGRPLELYLASEMTFDVKIEFPSGTFPLYNSLRMGFILEGFYARPKVSERKL